jgi:acyl-CoA thioesterase-1
MAFKAKLGFLTALAITALLSVGAARAEPVKLVGFGDSLMAGYQLPAGDASPVKLEAALRDKGHEVEIANAGVSGDTTSGGLARLDWSVPDGTQGVILELGANDALRGVAPEETEKNLDTMLTRLKERGIPVLLAGMLAPPNMGPEYGERFNAIYQKLADRHDVPLYPFFLEGVVTKADLQLEDGMHPNARGVDAMVQAMLPAVEGFLTSIKAGE